MNSEGFPIPGHDLSICAGGSVTLVRIEQCELFRGGVSPWTSEYVVSWKLGLGLHCYTTHG